MTLEEFQDLDGWPEELERFAEQAKKVCDCPELQEAAEQYLHWRDVFNHIMFKYGVEIG